MQKPAAPVEENAKSFFLVDDPLFDEHRARGYHPERPERLIAARHATNAVKAHGIAARTLRARDATEDEIARVHAGAYVELLERSEGLFSALDDDTYLSPRSVAAAYRAAGGAIAMVDELLSAGPGASSSGIALLRPPGHHARPDRGMGFCLLNNVAIAAAHARARGIERVAIVDWDVHHGNGTQEAFYKDPHVLFVSLHQYPFYPGTGSSMEVGEGEGKGFTVNVPLSPNASDLTYRAAFERIVLPVLEEYSPELVLVSAGFDAHARDPLAGMALSADGFRYMAQAVKAIADRSAGGKIGVVLEGGYDLEGLESSLHATIETVAGAPVPAEEQSDAHADEREPSPLSTRHGLEIDRVRRHLSAHWKI
ncbi:MAG: histone deacetylase [Polyangiaceae bacterium]|nr:histone deacetylase [Polyangiaceae bacterium]